MVGFIKRQKALWVSCGIIALGIVSVMEPPFGVLALVLLWVVATLIVICRNEDPGQRLAAALLLLPVCVGGGGLYGTVVIWGDEQENTQLRMKQAALVAFESATGCDARIAKAEYMFKLHGIRVEGCGSERTYRFTKMREIGGKKLYFASN